MSARTYPPTLSKPSLQILIAAVKDYQLTHGSTLKLVITEQEHTVHSYPVGTTLFPTLFPIPAFDTAESLQSVYNKLYASISCDPTWIYSVLQDVIKLDPFAKILWEIHEKVESRNRGVSYAPQGLQLGIWRSDYMLHHPNSSEKHSPELKQIEFNTIACAGGTHSNIISDMHQYVHSSGFYGSPPLTSFNNHLPGNKTLYAITSGLAAAHRAYGPVTSSPNRRLCILMIVQPNNFNIADERPIEYALTSPPYSIPTCRLEFGYSVLEHTSLKTPTGELIYDHPITEEIFEVSVVYYRAGFEASEYIYNRARKDILNLGRHINVGKQARESLEMSRAIKCPSILGHLATFKKVQQALSASPDCLRRWLSAEEAATIRKTFMPMYSLNDEFVQEIFQNEQLAGNLVLKPNKEGGGHNVYGSDIPNFLNSIDKKEWGQYILMERVQPPQGLQNTLMSWKGLFTGDVCSELGIFGVCLFQSGTEIPGGTVAPRVPSRMKQFTGGWSLKTKDCQIDEMSVVKGYGCFDSPLLVDNDTFMAQCNK